MTPCPRLPSSSLPTPPPPRSPRPALARSAAPQTAPPGPASLRPALLRPALLRPALLRPALLLPLLALPGLLGPSSARAITRDQVMTTARAYAYHPWHCSAQNLDGGCPPGYRSAYVVGDHMGLPYDWGGYMTLHQFDAQIAEGKAAGSPPGDVLACTAGLDCSGFVAQCWQVAQLGTWGLPQVSTTIARDALRPGDAIDEPGYHVVLWSHRQADGRPFLYEAMGYNVHPTFTMGWEYVEGFLHLRLDGIEDGQQGEAAGTAENPIVIDGFPFMHSGDTAESPSDLLDFCAAAPDRRETGPEVVHQARPPTPRRLLAGG